MHCLQLFSFTVSHCASVQWVKGCSLQLQPSQIKAFFCSLHMSFTVITDMLHVIANDIQYFLMFLTELRFSFGLSDPPEVTMSGDVC